MAINRTFIDWSRPALPQAIEFLVGKFAESSHLNLDNVVVVVPGSRAGRRLLELLVHEAEQRSLILYPPQIKTVGALPELLYESKRPFASDLIQQMAWLKALQSSGTNRIRQLTPQVPKDDDFEGWFRIATLLWRQHRELAGDGLNFNDVVRVGSKIGGFQESGRWRLLRRIQESYLAHLDKLKLWDMQTARLFAIEHRECRTDKEIVLLATADMNRATRLMLDQVADRVTALIHAPRELANRFDEHGCVNPEVWTSVKLDLDSEQIQIVESPSDQAEAVVRTIAGFDGKYRPDEISVGMPDDRLVPQVARQLMQYNVPSRWAIGKRLPETSPYRLLEMLARYVERRRTSDFAALVRHPDVHDWVERQGVEGDWLTQLDDYYNRHLQPRLDEWLGKEDANTQIKSIQASLQNLIDRLLGKPRKLHRWADEIARVLLDFYADADFDTDDPIDYFTVESFRRIRKALLEHQSVPSKISPTLPASEAIRLLLNQLSSDQVPTRTGEPAIELLGWLELPLDLAPALVVTSFNDGFIPTSLNSDQFLPNSLRRRLGIVDNARRYARDAYALSVLLASRQEFTLISGRRDLDGNPLLPSRLAFATEPKTIAHRSIDFFQPQESAVASRPLIGHGVAEPPQSEFIVRKPAPLDEPVAAMSVTAFRSYLACPYRFYLRYVLRLEQIDDRAEELDAPTFGNVMHDVLEWFGREDEVCDSNDPEKIRRFLRHAMNRRVEHVYGDSRLPAVEVQLGQLQQRFNAFADWQASWNQQGWRIKHTEVSSGDEPVRLNISADESMILRGRIDRIDQNERTGEWAVFDYKTGDAGKKPEEMHKRGREWVDLQLPLYRHLVRSLGIEENVRLGYIVLPKDTTKVGPLIAEWSDMELHEADEVAMNVASRVLNQEFWPPKFPPPRILTDFRTICQEGAFERRIEGVNA